MDSDFISFKLLAMPCFVFIMMSGTLILWFISVVVPVVGFYEEPFIKPSRCILSVATPLFTCYYGLKKGSLSYSGSQTGFVIGFIMTMSSYTFMASLLVFFIVCSKVTNWRSSDKKTFEENFKEGGKRNWLQVLCNGGVAAELALLYCIDSSSKELPINFSKYYTSSWLSCGIIGALACSCGDTFASEIGAAIGAEPRLITNLQRVPKGTNGAISIVGTMASGLGGFLIGLTFFATNMIFVDAELFYASPPQWPIVLLGTYAGFIGSLLDSLLGATLQFSGINKETGVICEYPGKNITPISGIPFFDNHNVNLLASIFTATLTSVTACKIFEHYQ